MLRFEWDPRKSNANRRQHGVFFEEAQSVFFDEEAIEFDDPAHSAQEARFLLLGRSVLLRVPVVCHCHRVSESTVRIISARKATPRERRVHARRGIPYQNLINLYLRDCVLSRKRPTFKWAS